MSGRKWRFLDLGLIDFGELIRIQDRLWEERVSGGGADTILFAEHPTVISLGVRPREEQMRFVRVPLAELAARNISIYETRRGGSITIHAPGILGCYVVAQVPTFGMGVVPWLEQVSSEALRACGLETHFKKPPVGVGSAKYRGLWTARGKIASVGVHCSHNVTRFGVSINVSADADVLTIVHPCGIEEYSLTTLALEGVDAPVSEIKEVVRRVVAHTPLH